MKCDFCGKDDDKVVDYPYFNAHPKCLDDLTDDDIKKYGEEAIKEGMGWIKDSQFSDDMERQRAEVNLRVNISRIEDAMMARNKLRREGRIDELGNTITSMVEEIESERDSETEYPKLPKMPKLPKPPRPPEAVTMIAYCGIVCTDCPAFIATRENDDAKRKEVAEMWSKQYKMSVKPEDINCDGCISGSKRLLGYCSVCEIRKCGQAKVVENCAYCDEYACEKLSKFIAMVPHAKASLEEIRKKK